MPTPAHYHTQCMYCMLQSFPLLSALLLSFTFRCPTHLMNKISSPTENRNEKKNHNLIYAQSFVVTSEIGLTRQEIFTRHRKTWIYHETRLNTTPNAVCVIPTAVSNYTIHMKKKIPHIFFSLSIIPFNLHNFHFNHILLVAIKSTFSLILFPEMNFINSMNSEMYQSLAPNATWVCVLVCLPMALTVYKCLLMNEMKWNGNNDTLECVHFINGWFNFIVIKCVGQKSTSYQNTQ